MSSHIALYAATACVLATDAAVVVEVARRSRVADVVEFADEPEPLQAARASAAAVASNHSLPEVRPRPRDAELARARPAAERSLARRCRAGGRALVRMKTSTGTKDLGSPACGQRFRAAATSVWQGPETRLWQRSRLLRR